MVYYKLSNEKGDDMTRDITYQGIDWEVGYDWEDDARSDMCITTIKVAGSDTDIYDHLQQSTIDGLFDALEESFK
jgi:hypothetical protein